MAKMYCEKCVRTIGKKGKKMTIDICKMIEGCDCNNRNCSKGD